MIDEAQFDVLEEREALLLLSTRFQLFDDLESLAKRALPADVGHLADDIRAFLYYHCSKLVEKKIAEEKREVVAKNVRTKIWYKLTQEGARAKAALQTCALAA